VNILDCENMIGYCENIEVGKWADGVPSE